MESSSLILIVFIATAVAALKKGLAAMLDMIYSIEYGARSRRRYLIN